MIKFDPNEPLINKKSFNIAQKAKKIYFQNKMKMAKKVKFFEFFEKI